MKLAKRLPGNAAWMGLSLLLALLPLGARGMSTTTVQGTLYRADGGIAKGTLLLSWPTFTTASNEAVASGSKTVLIGSNGWVSVALASNYGASPDGTFYTAVLHLSDGTTSTEYWLVPATTTAEIAGVRTQIMPAYIAARSVNKQYVDTSMAAFSAGLIPATGGSMSGPLTLSGDPVGAQQASTKHYVDQAVTSLLPITGGWLQGPLTLSGDPSSDSQAATKHYVDQSAQGTLQKSGGTMTGALTLSGDPVSAPQASTKHYVDQAVTSLLPLAGGWLQGPLTLSGDPSSDSQAATKHYVDQSAQGTLQKSGGTMTGALTLSADPVAAEQASTKHYVDQAVTSLLPITGGWLQGPLTLSGDPSSDSQAATKHYVDLAALSTLQKSGGTMTGALVAPTVNGKVFPTATTLQAAVNAAASMSPKGSVEIPANYAGTDSFTNASAITVEDKRTTIPVNARSVKEFGAQCLGPVNADASLTSGSSVLTLMIGEGYTTSTAMIGRYVVLSASMTHQAFTSVFMPTITGVIDSSHYQLSATAPFSMAQTGFGQYPSVSFYQDDLPGIQAAHNFAYDSGANSSYPKVAISYPQGTCFVSDAINYRGEDFFGVSVEQSVIRGAPGKDVFAGSDYGDAGITRAGQFQWNHVHDVSIQTNASVDANITPNWSLKKRGGGQGSIFANTYAGWAGQKVKAPVLATATTIPLTNAVDLTQYKTKTVNGWLPTGNTAPWGWVKIGTEFIHYQGISATGCPNSAPLCLLNAQRHITLAGVTSSAVDIAVDTNIAPVNPLDPADVTEWIPAWIIGSGSFSFPARTGCTKEASASITGC